MPDINPIHFAAIQDLLTALGFAVSGESYTKGKVTFPVTAIGGHTPLTFYDNAKQAGWLDEQREEEPADAELPIWNNGFFVVFSYFLD